MPKYITVPYDFQQVIGSKHVTIQVEIKTNTTCSAVKKLICLDTQQQQQFTQNIPAPHHAAFLATVIRNIKDSLVSFKSKKDNPVQLDFGVFDGKFLLSMQFLTDNASFRQVLKLIISKIFNIKFEQAFKSLKKFDKSFTDSNDKDSIQKSMQSMLGQTAILVLSKHSEEQILPMIKKAVEDITKKQIEELQDTIKFNQSYQDDQYTRFPLQKNQISELIYFMLLASLNMQGIDYIVDKDKLFIKKGEIENNTVRNCINFINERLKFADKSKIKHYADQTAKYKEKITAQAHKAKYDLQKTKKVVNLIQVLYSTGSIGMSQKKVIYDDLFKLDLERAKNMLKALEDCLKQLTKIK